MKRKRFKHISFTVCHMFSGWQLINSYKDIKSYGSGIYQYDFKLNELRFNGDIIRTLNIFDVLQVFFNQEIERMRIDLNSILEAYIVIDMHYYQNQIGKPNNKNEEVFLRDNKTIDSLLLNAIEYKCVSCIETDERQYTALLSASNGWPEGWLNN